jgi:hypothetical protein
LAVSAKLRQNPFFTGFRKIYWAVLYPFSQKLKLVGFLIVSLDPLYRYKYQEAQWLLSN